MKMLIANKLSDGFVVFLTATGDWTYAIGSGAIARSETEWSALLEQGTEAAKNNEVVDPYLIDVTLETGAPTPVVFREYIRAYGPSVAIPA